MFGFLSSTVLCVCLFQGLGVNAHKQLSVLRAQIAADAAALAAVTHDDETAAHFAVANGGRLVSLRHFGNDGEYVEVVVSIDGMQASATATHTW